MRITYILRVFTAVKYVLFTVKLYLCLGILYIKIPQTQHPKPELASAMPEPQEEAGPTLQIEETPAPHENTNPALQAVKKEARLDSAPTTRECLICKENDHVSGLVTFCTHYYHMECITSWWRDLITRRIFRRGECAYCFEPVGKIIFGCGHDCTAGNTRTRRYSNDIAKKAHARCRLCLMRDFHRDSRVGGWFKDHAVKFREALDEREERVYDHTSMNKKSIRTVGAMPIPTARGELAWSMDYGMTNLDILPVRMAVTNEHPTIQSMTKEQWARVMGGHRKLRVRFFTLIDLEDKAYGNWSRGDVDDEAYEQHVLFQALRVYRQIDRKFEHLWGLIHDYDLVNLRQIRKAQSSAREWGLVKLEKELEGCGISSAGWRKLYLPCGTPHTDRNVTGYKAFLDQVLKV